MRDLLAKPAVGRPTTPYRPMLWLGVAAGLGVAVDYGLYCQTGRSYLVLWYLASLAAAAAAAVARRRRRFRTAALLLLAAAAALGAAWHDWRWNFVSVNDLARFAREAPQPTCVDAVLAERVKISPAAASTPLRAIPSRPISEATVRVIGIRDGKRWQRAAGLSRLRVAGELHGVEAGDRVRVYALLARPRPPLNPGEYDWAAAERRAGRLSELYCVAPQCVQVTTRAGRIGVWPAVRATRAWCERTLFANVSPSAAPLVLATLLGDQERLPDATKDAFLNTGSIHLLVVSGAHVALLAGLAWTLARGGALPTRLQVAVTAGFVVVYAAVVGPQPSVMRATLLTLALFAALARGRAASAGNLLGAAAMVVIAYNPCELFRAGTQFSFLAVAVLIAFARLVRRRPAPDPLQRLIEEARPWTERAGRWIARWFLGMTAASLAVGVVMAPLVAYHFHVVTPASVLLTPIAGPLIAIALATGVGVVTLGGLVPPLGAALGAVCGGCLQLAERLVLLAQETPGSYFYSPGFDAWWLWGFYGAAALVAAVPRWRPAWHWQVSTAFVWLAVGYGAGGPPAAPASGLRCSFLAMGHGTCVVLQLPGGQTVLYDAGSLNSPELAAETVAAFLWSRGIERVDALIVSHADIDHYNAVPGLVQRFPVAAVYVSPMMFDPVATDGDLRAPNYLRDVLAEAEVPLREVWMGDRLATADDRVTIEVLHPPEEGVFGRDNANSLLLSVEFAGKRILLPGDLESPGIDRVMADPPLDCDILLAPHHGSAGSDPPGFASWCTPEWVVMSGSEPDRTMLAQRSYQRSGAAVFHTAERGALEFQIWPGGLEFSAFRSPPGGDAEAVGKVLADETASQYSLRTP